MAIARDLVVGGLVVLVLLSALWLYAGQPLSRAPVVSIESGSMMHGPQLGGSVHRPYDTPWGEPPYGRVGTIDPGDIVVVRDVDEPEDVVPTFDVRAKTRYGAPGDVIVFAPNGMTDSTHIIHRAVLLVQAFPEGCLPTRDCVFRIPAACDPLFATWNSGPDASKYCDGSSDPITLTLSREGIVVSLENYPCSGPCAPFYTSFVTKGDNNGAADQQSSISGPVRVEWIVGKARLELPWFGLIKLSLFGNDRYVPASDPSSRGNLHLFRADAPTDIWVCLALSIALVVTGPMLAEFFVKRWRKKSDRA